MAVTFWALANGIAARTAAAARVRDVELSLMMFDVFWLGLEGWFGKILGDVGSAERLEESLVSEVLLFFIML